MRRPRVRFTVSMTMLVIAMIGSILGIERLWKRAEFYRKQAALCAFFEHQYLSYAAAFDHDRESSTEEREENVRGNLAEAHHYGVLKAVYRHVASLLGSRYRPMRRIR